MSKLKPCAFCNSVNFTLFDQPCIAWVQCSDCEADGPPKDTAAEAIEAWNRAPASSEQQAAQQDTELIDRVIDAARNTLNECSDAGNYYAMECHLVEALMLAIDELYDARASNGGKA